MSKVAELAQQGKTPFPAYRTMDDNKKTLAILGHVPSQREWMREEINEFREAIHLGNREEIIDECFGLLRTAQQFPITLEMLLEEAFFISSVMFMCDLDREYAKFAAKKHAKGQASDMTLACLLEVFEQLEATANSQAEEQLNQNG